MRAIEQATIIWMISSDYWSFVYGIIHILTISYSHPECLIPRLKHYSQRPVCRWHGGLKILASYHVHVCMYSVLPQPE